VTFNKTTDGRICFFSTNTYLWQPAHLTTYVLPVIDIENAIVDLNYYIENPGNNSPEQLLQIKVQIDNWKTVLQNYRQLTIESTKLFSAEQVELANLLRRYEDLQMEPVDISAISRIVGVETTLLATSLIPYFFVPGYAYLFLEFSLLAAIDIGTAPRGFQDSRVSGLFGKTKTSCEMAGANNEVITNICKDIDSKKWDNFLSAMQGYCRDSNPVFSETFVSLCIQKKDVVYKDLPQSAEQAPLSSAEQSMFSFLESKENYLTFAANAPVVLAWSSSETAESNADRAFEATFESSFAHGGNFAGNLAVGVVELTGNVAKKASKTASSHTDLQESHTTGKSITVTLDDGDNG
jgi:hypothetical protein